MQTLKNIDTTKALALLIALPAYVIFFIGKEPLMQGLAYACYPVALLLIFYQSKKINFSKKFMSFWLFFILAWCIPSLINSQSNQLESDLVRLDVLFVNVFYLTSILVTFMIWFKEDAIIRFNSLLSELWLILMPMATLITLKSLYLFFIHNQTRPWPFNVDYGVASELLLVFTICSLVIKNNILKIASIAMCAIGLYILDTRSIYIPFYFLLFSILIFPHIKNFSLKGKLISLIIFLALIFFLQDFLLDNFFKVTDAKRNFESGITGRLKVWLVAVESIQNNLWLGLGYWVDPAAYSLPASYPGSAFHHPSFVIHNAFLRIIVENGLLLGLLVIGLSLYSVLKAIKKKLIFELFLILSILFTLCFSTRHLTLNLLNLILYLAILGTLIDKKKNTI